MSELETEPSSLDREVLREQRLFTVVTCGFALLGALAVWAACNWDRGRVAELAEVQSSPSGSNSSGKFQDRWLADFELVERSGRKVSRGDLGNRYLVLNLVFSSCSMGCQEVNRRMAEIQTRVGTNNDIRLVSISIDPRTDTPEALARFAKGFQADTNRWLFLTGTKTAIADLLEQSFFPGLQGENLLIPNGLRLTQEIMLIDPAGKLRATFNGMDPQVTDSVLAEIQHIRQPRVRL